MDMLQSIRPLWSTVETWAVRFFIFLGVLTLFPWILLILFDAGLYVWRYLILAPIARILGLQVHPPETPVVSTIEESEMIRVSKIIDDRARRRMKTLEGSEPIMGVAGMGDGLDRVLREKEA